MLIQEAVRILSEYNIMSVPVLNPDPNVKKICWRSRYLGILDYPAILAWILDNADLAAVQLLPDILSAECTAANDAASTTADDSSATDEELTAATSLGEEFVTRLLKREPFRPIPVCL